MIVFTIITKDYLAYAKAVKNSFARNYDGEFRFIAFVTSLELDDDYNDSEIEIMSFKSGLEIEKVKLAFQKYGEVDIDSLRYTLKPILIEHFLKSQNKVIYCDSDLYFTGNVAEMVHSLDHNNVLITPHWFPITPDASNGYLKKAFFDGIYNAGFVAFNKQGIDAAIWWGNACLFNCSRDQDVLNTFVDQTYLNLFPIYFDKVKILDEGYNAAGWNEKILNWTVSGFCTSVLEDVRKTKEVKFIHFSPYTFSVLKDNNGEYWTKIRGQYIEELKNYGLEINPIIKHNKNLFWYVGKLLPKQWLSKVVLSRRAKKSK